MSAALTHGGYTRLTVVAAPALFGVLRNVLPTEVAGGIVNERGKDVVTQPLEEVISYFPSLGEVALVPCLSHDYAGQAQRGRRLATG